MEIPGIETEDVYDKIIAPTPIGEEEKPQSYAECGAKLRKKSGLDTSNQVRAMDKTQDEVIVIDDDDGDVSGDLFRGVFLKEGPIDSLSVSG